MAQGSPCSFIFKYVSLCVGMCSGRQPSAGARGHQLPWSRSQGACATLNLDARDLRQGSWKGENALNLKPSLQTQEQVPNAILTAFLYILNYFNMINNFSFYLSMPGFNNIFQSSLSQQRLIYIQLYIIYNMYVMYSYVLYVICMHVIYSYILYIICMHIIYITV